MAQPFSFLPEDELDDIAISQDLTPDDAITDRPPIGPVGNPKVADIIKSRMNRGPMDQPKADPYLDDPLMKDYQKREADLNSFRQSKAQADLASNLGQSFSQLAQGANAPKPNGVFESIDKQNAGMLKSQEEDLDRRQKIINAIESRKAREAATSNIANYRDAAMKLRQDQMNNRLSSLNIGKVNQLYADPNINRETNKLNAARSAQTLLDSIKSGELIDSKNIRNQLTSIMSTIELGGPGAVADRQAMGVNNLYSAAQDALSYIDSNPNKTIAPKYLVQLGVEAKALGDRAAKNYTALVNSKLSGADLSGGNPEIDPGQIHQLATQRKLNFLKGNGYDPEGNSLIPSAHAGGDFGPKKIKAPNGSIRIIPADKVQAALAAGGVEVNE